MKASSSEIFRQALDLAERDRAMLAGLLIESLEGEEPDQDLEAAWKDEIQRRVRELDSGDVKTIPWEEVKNRLFQILAVAHANPQSPEPVESVK